MEMLEKLKEDHDRCRKIKIGGHRIGFFCEDGGPRKLVYPFEKGVYRLALFDERDGFCWFDYVPRN